MATSKIEALVKEKCPRCGEGDLFSSPAYNLKKFHYMHEDCPKCNLRYEVEPGFFIGAMYVSYAISVGLLIIIGSLIYLNVKDAPLWVYMVSIASIPVIFLPFIFRFSRVLFLYLFGGVEFKTQA